MNGERILAIVEKEWLDMCKNKMVISLMAFLPVLMVGMILGTTYFMQRAPEEELNLNTGSGSFGLPPELAALGAKEGFIALMNDQYMFYLLLIPMALPVYVAAYSIIGEKETRSLEPLLATPISTAELLVGKTIAAVTPAVILSNVLFQTQISEDSPRQPGAPISLHAKVWVFRSRSHLVGVTGQRRWIWIL